MNAIIRRIARRVSPFLLAAAFVAGPALCRDAFAQRGPNEPAPEEAASGSAGGGSALNGYIGTFILVFLALFIVGKSARR